MKYMGSKRAMLQNGLGELIQREASDAVRFVDLFSGSAAVAIHVASRFDIAVLAFDLQAYSSALANAVLRRQAPLSWATSWRAWMRRAEEYAQDLVPPECDRITQRIVADLRKWCNNQMALPVTRAYGGHYFSPRQAIWIDALRATAPTDEPARGTALAALIQAASQCAAAPGHTAQPFSTNAYRKTVYQGSMEQRHRGENKECF